MLANYEVSPGDKKFIGLHILFATAALSIGMLFGPLQAFEHAGWDLYPYIQPLFKSYYQGLTLHGVLNALVWTTFFITGFLTLTTIYGLKRPLRNPVLNRVGFWMMVVGLVTTAIPLLLDEASVLYTFYPPMKAHWAFYLGLTLVVVGSWVEGWGFYTTYYAWRKENPGVRTPLMTFGGLITMVMWQIATLGVAAEILTMLLPWSLGLIEGADPQLARTYFWFTGHPLVYFWLLPAYVSWYAMMPKQAGGKLFSDSLARFAFWLFLLLSVPLGFHHQYVDPGVPAGWKFLHAVLTYSVFLPSMLTAFTVIASLEYAGRKRGGKGLLGWIRALPWNDPSVTAQLLGGILFFFGGIGGITNASYNVNLVVHNTAWVPGHFHLTVASAVTMSFMGISYWLVPYLTNKKLWKPKWAVAQTWIWFVGMLIFSNAMHVVGLLGAPRRTPLGLAPYIPEEWSGHLLRVGIGGGILFIGGYLFIVIVAKTAFARKAEAADIVIPVAEAKHDPQETPDWLDRWVPWLIGTVALLLIAYGPQLIDQISNISLTSPGFKVW
ncbi:MAG: b(o/a)3-type cytochrome-c oxidase subunit 1 [Ardenticatenaceae bacterium]|nr:b(o/a)3-type cytochrome-c oxidase subunit 1 [Ardenticatenaceae bacterium]MCB9445778.1 b(o/a)3-type cytochrome-c oxidase subunit 1 [Ardenticatenaceae bacterium]